MPLGRSVNQIVDYIPKASMCLNYEDQKHHFTIYQVSIMGRAFNIPPLLTVYSNLYEICENMTWRSEE